MEPSAASSGEMDGDGAAVGAGGVAGREAFGADRRGLSGFLVGAKLWGSLNCWWWGGSSGGTIDASVNSGG